MTRTIQPGDQVRLNDFNARYGGGPDSAPDGVYTVTGLIEFGGDIDALVNLEGETIAFDSRRFDLVEPEVVAVEQKTLALIVPDDIDPAAIPRRGYDFKLGDRRFNDRQHAVDFAVEQANQTGTVFTIRRDPSTPHFVDLYLVQALGS